MAISQHDRMKVFRTVRAELLMKGLRCGQADDGAFNAVQIFKRCVKRGCADPIGFVTSAKSIARFAEAYAK